MTDFCIDNWSFITLPNFNVCLTWEMMTVITGDGDADHR